MPTTRHTRAPVIHKGRNPSRHELAIRLILQRDPEAHRNGFWAALKDLYCAYGRADEAPRQTFVPDAYKLDYETETLVIYEVEDTNPISPDKIRALTEFWFELDADDFHDWLPEVRIVDRYGNETGTLDLCGLYYASMAEDAADA